MLSFQGEAFDTNSRVVINGTRLRNQPLNYFCFSRSQNNLGCFPPHYSVNPGLNWTSCNTCWPNTGVFGLFSGFFTTYLWGLKPCCRSTSSMFVGVKPPQGHRCYKGSSGAMSRSHGLRSPSRSNILTRTQGLDGSWTCVDPLGQNKNNTIQYNRK